MIEYRCARGSASGAEFFWFEQARRGKRRLVTVLIRQSLLLESCSEMPRSLLGWDCIQARSEVENFLPVGSLCYWKFAESLKMVPKTLAEYAGLNAINVISSLYAEHANGIVKVSINLEEGTRKDVSAMNVWDLYITKFFALEHAADVRIGLIRWILYEQGDHDVVVHRLLRVDRNCFSACLSSLFYDVVATNCRPALDAVDIYAPSKLFRLLSAFNIGVSRSSQRHKASFTRGMGLELNGTRCIIRSRWQKPAGDPTAAGMED
ncbi:hypothetical protein NL676_001461 [Syzygium grande]|nr:hypothetical protein NL676_001461 [Syzygium grande]